MIRCMIVIKFIRYFDIHKFFDQNFFIIKNLIIPFNSKKILASIFYNFTNYSNHLTAHFILSNSYQN